MEDASRTIIPNAAKFFEFSALAQEQQVSAHQRAHTIARRLGTL